MSQREYAYLSVIDWPDTLDEQARTEALTGAAGLDLFTARQRVVRGTPQVVARIPADKADAAVEVLREAGATAFAPTGADLAALGSPLRAKRLIPATGAPEPMYAVEPWRGDGCGMKASDLFLLVRSRLRKTTSRTPSAPDISLGTSLGWGTVGYPVTPSSPWTPEPTSSTSISDVMDLYLRDNTRIRVDGDKFSFDVLGDQRGLTDGESMDRLALLLAGQAPKALVDTSFSRFVCPPDIVRDAVLVLRDSTVRTRQDSPVFEFYSPWCCLLYRFMLNG